MKHPFRKLFLTLLVFTSFAISSVAQQIWYGLWNSSMGIKTNRELSEGSIDQYIRLTPQNSKQLIGGKVHGMRFWIYDKTAVKQVRVWLSTSYTKGGTPSIMQQTVDIADLKDYVHDNQPTEVFFSQAYDILPEGNAYAFCFAGFSLQLASTPTFYQLVSDNRSIANSNYIDGSDYASQYGALPLQILASGTNVSGNVVSPQPFAEQIAVANSAASFNVNMINYSSEAVRSIDYAVITNGQQQPTQHYDFPQPVDELAMTVEVPVNYTVPAETVLMDMAVKVTHVNGQPISSAEQSTAEGKLISLNSLALRRTVMEEFTGTWCNNCVRGISGTHLLLEQYGDRFIPIAVHGDDRDPMMIDDYYRSEFFRDAIRQLGGYPSCTIDRYYYCDPYCGFNTTGAFQTDKIVEDALQKPSVADLNVVAYWTDSNLSSINYDVQTRFGYSSDTGNYSLVFVLTADGLEGMGRAWQQSNGYNNYTGTEEALLEYVGKGNYLTDMTYNHVAIAVAGCDDGIDNSISLPLVAGQQQHYRYTMNVEDNELVQDPEQLSAVVMLIDTRDGTVVNAATCTVGDGTGINSLTKDADKEETIYDLQGRKLSSPPSHGIYIIGGKKIAKKVVSL